MLQKRTTRCLALCSSLIILITALGVFAYSDSASSNQYVTDDQLEQEIATFMMTAPGQRRASLAHNAILARVARERAYDMGRRNYFSHVNPDGIGPNYLVTVAGYGLPDFYGNERSANNIESIASGSATATAAWAQWMGSSGHREHTLGLTDFYAAQTDYGVGHAFVPGSRWGHYWVVITARHGEASVPAVASESTTADANSDCEGSKSRYPHVLRGADGKLKPECGYTWLNSDPDDYRVRAISATGNATPATSSNTEVSSSDCEGTESSYPNVIKGANGKLKPKCGYDWLNDDPGDYRVQLMEGLVRTDTGLRPASGYQWLNSAPKDFRVELMPGLVRTAAGKLLPATGYRWVRPNDPKDFRVERIP